MTENKEEIKKEKVEIPKYRLSEVGLEMGIERDMFPMDLEDLIFEKMFLLFEKLEPLNNLLKDNELALQIQKETMLMETDFEKELDKKRPTIAEKDAWMRPFLSENEEKIEKIKQNVTFYKNKILIINDLIKMRRLQLKMEGALIE